MNVQCHLIHVVRTVPTIMAALCVLVMMDMSWMMIKDLVMVSVSPNKGCVKCG